jgi:thymidylate synthase
LFDINLKWQNCINDIISFGDEVSPRGQLIKEFVGYQIKFDMLDPIITLKDRKLNYSFAFGEAWWICSGSNKVSDITQYMKSYVNYSDNGVFLNGAYGPKFIDQVSYVVDSLIADNDSRQAFLNIWRENPRGSKDVPCTTSMQFFIRNNKLCTVVNMRSQDMIWGFGYDSFTFTMMSKVVQILLLQRGIDVNLGILTINQGSAHIYEKHWEDAIQWAKLDNANHNFVDGEIIDFIDMTVHSKLTSYDYFIEHLKYAADKFKA